MSNPLRAVISGTGMAVPTQVVTNDHFSSYLDTSDEWITTRTGIKARFRAGQGDTTVSLAKEASLKALDNAGISASDLDMILFATASPNTPIPASACWLQAELGIEKVAAFDINAACAGLTYGLAQAAMFIDTGHYRNVLVIGAEILTRICDPEDRTTCILFGDAAAAVVMTHTQDPNRGLIYHELGADGRRADYIWMPAGGTALPTSSMTVAERLHYIKMKGREVYKFAVVKFTKLVQDCLEATGLTMDDIDYLIPHQSNLRIIESVQAKLGVPREKLAVNIERYGNTSAASVGLALDEARRTGRVRQGDLVLMLALGAGLTWGVTLFRM